MSGFGKDRDRTSIQQVLCAYSTGVDERDWLKVRNCYHDDAIDNHGVYSGGVDGLVAHFAHALKIYESTLHLVSIPKIEFTSDSSAVVETPSIAFHWSKEKRPHLLVAANYCDQFDMRNGNWRIAHRDVVLLEATEYEAVNQNWKFSELFLRAQKLKVENDV